MFELLYDGGVGSSVSLIETSAHRILVDTSARESLPLILSRLEELGIRPGEIDAIINTHLHSNHTANNDAFPNAEVYASPNECVEKCGGCLLYKSRWSAFSYTPVSELRDDEVIVINTPGHTWGSISVIHGYYVIVGDAVPYRNCIDRWEIPSFVDEIAMKSSLTRILRLGKKIVTGHDGIVEL